MGKKLTKKLLVFLTLMCMIIGMNVSVSAETGSTGNTKAISAAENPADGTLQVWLEYEDDNGNSVALSGGSCFLINEEYPVCRLRSSQGRKIQKGCFLFWEIFCMKSEG